MKTDEQILAEIEKASFGLLYMSESDYAFELIRWDGSAEITPEFLRSVTAEPTDAPIEERDYETFLRRYQGLAQVLKSSLSEIKVYKVGRINIPVYVVGRSPAGSWLGVSTRVVET